MQAVAKALDEVKYRIPKEILDAVFIRREARWRSTPASIDEVITAKVVRPRVMVDCNLCGGTEVFISLDGIPSEVYDDLTRVYRIPKSKTQNRSILSVLNITFSDPSRATTFGSFAQSQNSAMLRAGQAMMDAHGTIPMTSTAMVRLMGENVVQVRDNSVLPANIYLRCVLMNDENMSHLQLRSYRAFSHMVTLAVKAFIYNEYIIQLDLGELFGGQNLGRIKEIIDGYADAEELYQTYLIEKWEKISFMNDGETYRRYIAGLVGGNR